MNKQRGFAAAIILVVIIVVSVVGFVEYKVYKNNASSANESAQTEATSEQKDITSAQDVTSTQNELDNINLDTDLDASVLDEVDYAYDDFDCLDEGEQYKQDQGY